MIETALQNLKLLNDKTVNIAETYLISEGNKLSFISKDNFDPIQNLKLLEYPIYFTYNQVLNEISDNCELSYIQGSCPENYLEDCNGECFHEWYMQFPGVGNGFCNDPWINVQGDMIESGNYNMVDESTPELGIIFTINSYGGFYEDLSYVNSLSPSFISSIPSNSHASGVSAHDYQRKTNDYTEPTLDLSSCQ